jgi:hypothetical protein
MEHVVAALKPVTPSCKLRTAGCTTPPARTWHRPRLQTLQQAHSRGPAEPAKVLLRRKRDRSNPTRLQDLCCTRALDLVRSMEQHEASMKASLYVQVSEGTGLGGSLRRECLDFLIPFNERRLNMIGKQWTAHYNRGRPHSSLSAGFPEGSQESVPAAATDTSFPPATG